jgi:glyoxylase-like metal-dependent hydrolase (beta-lactamase superfamily II)
LLQSHLGAQSLDLIVNSHLHSDHCGGNAHLQTLFPNVHVQISQNQLDQVLEWNHAKLTYQVTGQECPPFSPTHALFHGAVLQTAAFQWQVLSAPGHDNDEFIFHQPDLNILFSADALWESGLGVIFPEFLGGIGFENVASTLDMIESLQPDWVLPGHGPAFSDFSKAIAQSRRRLDLFMHSPEQHAHYSAKVLLKFHLLEQQSLTLSSFKTWCTSNKMLHLIHHNFFDHLGFSDWVTLLTEELVTRRAALIHDGMISNL